MKNLRFWVLWNDDFVKLTVRPKQTILLQQGGPTDEEWSSYREHYYQEDGALFVEVTTDGRDCDGRISTYAEFWCLADELRHHAPKGDRQPQDVHLPYWRKGRSEQRDYTAEAAGY